MEHKMNVITQTQDVEANLAGHLRICVMPVEVHSCSPGESSGWGCSLLCKIPACCEKRWILFTHTLRIQ